MAKSAILAVRIIGDGSGATRAMSSTASSANGLAARFGAVSGVVSGVVGSMTSSVIGHVKNLAGEMTATSDSAQSFANTLSFAGVDGSKIQALTKSTQQYADQTVFSLSDIRNTTAQLAANGVQGYDQLAQAAGNLTAVAGGGADAYKSVAMVLTQTAGAGKLTTENWNQLSDAIPGASGKLQEAMRANGAYTGNFRDAMAQGQITSDEFNQALMQLGMSDAAKKAANDTSQMSNAAGNADAAIVKFGSGLLDLVKPTVTGFMATFADKVSNLADDIPGVAGQVGQWAGQLASIASTIAPVVIGVGTFAAGIGVLYAVMSAGGILQWVGSLSAVTSATQIWTTVTTAAKDAQAAFNLVLDANPVAVVVLAIAALVAGLVWFFTQTQTGRQIWGEFTSFLGSTVQSIQAWFGQAGDWITAKWGQVTAFFGSIPGVLGGFFAGIGQWLSQPFKDAGTWAQGAWTSAVGFFQSIPGRIAGFFSDLGDKLLSPFRWAVDQIKNLWNSTIGGFGFDLPDWIPGVGGKSFRIPMLAQGGILTRSGSVLVGEAGPELLDLPQGARVTPLSRTRYSLSGQSATNGRTLPVNITINMEGVALDGYETGKRLVKALREYTEASR